MGTFPVLDRLIYNGKTYEPGKKPVTIDVADLIEELQLLKVIGDKPVSAKAGEPTLATEAVTVKDLTKLGKTKLAALAKAESIALPTEAKDAPAMATAIFAARETKAAEANAAEAGQS
jgi:hypothetical protein